MVDGIRNLFQEFVSAGFRTEMGTSAFWVETALIFIVLSLLLYFFRGTRSANVLLGLIVMLGIAGLLAENTRLLNIKYLLDELLKSTLLVMIIIFQPELRRALAQTGSIFSMLSRRNQISTGTIKNIAHAAFDMAKARTGALIVFEQDIGLESIVKSSVSLDARPDQYQLQSIFFKNSPLHDGAVIIREGRIVAARAVLPLAPEDESNPAMNRGMRHRAAIGITEDTDAVVIVVSEETGTVSVAYDHGRKLEEMATEAELIDSLTGNLDVVKDAKPQSQPGKDKKS